MTARHHHYLSQCYLKGFTKGGAKKSKLTVIDCKERKKFETIPRNVGGIRDFNRVDIKGIDQNTIESALSKFEGHAATALKKLEETLEFSGDKKEIILNLIALIAVRSPERREHMRNFEAQVADKIMGLTLESKERWESQVTKLEEGMEDSNKVTYEEAKKFFDKKAYTIEVAREHHIHMEMEQVNAVLPYLLGRKWVLIKATDNSGKFITSDNPVRLSWNEPEKIPPLYRDSPGFGMKGTQVYFPVSKNLALIGDFDSEEGTIEGTQDLVSLLNTKMINNVYKHIYSPNIDFTFQVQDGRFLNGNHLLHKKNA